MRRVLGAALTALMIGLSGVAGAQDKVVVWWNKGFYPAEDAALNAVIQKWEKQSGQKIELSFFSTEDMVAKTLSAVEAGSPPDLAFGWTFDMRTSPRWANDGKLEDVSDVVGPLKDRYAKHAIDSVSLLNNKAGKRSIYAIPVEQQIEHLHYWADMLKDAGINETDIPRRWEEFWSFWCEKVQPAVRRKTGQRLYGTGLQMSTGSTDTFYHFYHFLNAYGVQWIDKDGKPLVDDPKVRAGIIKALDGYTKIAKSGCTPSSAINWSDGDNNANFHNKTTVMTPNPSLSIPGKWLDDKNEDAYYNKIRTVEWPDGPNGEPITYIASVKQAVIFTDSKNKAGAKSFIGFLIQPENLGPYIEGAFGRWYPVMPELANTPFWTDTKDPHKSVAHRQYTQRPIVPFPQVYNYKVGAVQAENVWGRAMGRILLENWTAEKAADEMVARIKELLS